MLAVFLIKSLFRKKLWKFSIDFYFIIETIHRKSQF